MSKQLKEFAPKYSKDAVETIPGVVYTPDEMNYRSHLISRLSSAKNQRDTTHMEFDDMDYQLYYETNLRAGNSYIEPKKNRHDTRVVTGTTREKENTLLSAILNYNLEPNVDAYDTDDFIISELGENLQDMIRKSREVELYDEKKPLIYRELLDQGTVFVEEVWVERFCMEKDVKMDWDEGVSVSKTNWKERLKKVYKGCETNLLPGTKVYLGNVKEFFIHKQPYLFTYETISYNEARSIFGKWERFKNVPRKVVHFQETYDNLNYRDWSLFEVEEDTVEIIKYQDKLNNEFMIMLNGVMMLPIGFPLTAVSPSGEYTLAKGDVEPIPFFAYSKSIPAKTKVDQQVLDEMIKLIILKTQQSFQPPLANNTGRALSKNLFMPGNIQNDVDTTKISPIFPTQGVTVAEFNAFQVIKGIVDEKSVSPVFSGDRISGQQTATEILEMKKQQMMKLGLVIWGVISLERQLSWLRLHNILTNWTKPIDTEIDEIKGKVVDVYRTITVKTDLENGKKGRRIIKMNPELAGAISPEQVEAEEEFLSEEMPTRVTYLNPEILRNLKATYFITITPTEKNTTELRRILFTQNLRDAATMFGIQSLNLDYLKERFAILAGEDPEKFYVKPQDMAAMMPPQEMQGMEGAQPQAAPEAQPPQMEAMQPQANMQEIMRNA